VRQEFKIFDVEKRRALHVESLYEADTKYPVKNDPATTGAATGAVTGAGIGATTGAEVGTIVEPRAVNILAILP
jgi:hypothetical protein